MVHAFYSTHQTWNRVVAAVTAFVVAAVTAFVVAAVAAFVVAAFVDAAVATFVDAAVCRCCWLITIVKITTFFS